MPTPLDYHTPDTEPDEAPLAVLVIPILATALNCGVGMHNGEFEPFGEFTMKDLYVQAGLPLAVIGCWVYWAVLVYRRGIQSVGVVLVWIWGTFQVLAAIGFLVGYFLEPWAR